MANRPIEMTIERVAAAADPVQREDPHLVIVDQDSVHHVAVPDLTAVNRGRTVMDRWARRVVPTDQIPTNRAPTEDVKVALTNVRPARRHGALEETTVIASVHRDTTKVMVALDLRVILDLVASLRIEIAVPTSDPLLLRAEWVEAMTSGPHAAVHFRIAEITSRLRPVVDGTETTNSVHPTVAQDLIDGISVHPITEGLVTMTATMVRVVALPIAAVIVTSGPHHVTVGTIETTTSVRPAAAQGLIDGILVHRIIAGLITMTVTMVHDVASPIAEAIVTLDLRHAAAGTIETTTSARPVAAQDPIDGISVRRITEGLVMMTVTTVHVAGSPIAETFAISDRHDHHADTIAMITLVRPAVAQDPIDGNLVHRIIAGLTTETMVHVAVSPIAEMFVISDLRRSAVQCVTDIVHCQKWFGASSVATLALLLRGLVEMMAIVWGRRAAKGTSAVK